MCADVCRCVQMCADVCRSMSVFLYTHIIVIVCVKMYFIYIYMHISHILTQFLHIPLYLIHIMYVIHITYHHIWIWVTFETLTVLPNPGIMVYVREVIPKWP